MAHSRLTKVVIISLLVLLVALGVLWYLGGKRGGGGALIYEPKDAAGNSQPVLTKEEKFQSFVTIQLTKQAVATTSLAEVATPESLERLHLVNTTDPAVIKNYGLALAQILAPLSAIRPNEAALVVEALDNQKPEVLEPVSQSQAIFAQIAEKLAGLAVPANAKTVHLELLSRVEKIAFLLANMQRALAAPLLALESSNAYVEESFNFLNALAKINDYFKQQQISFTTAERLTIPLPETK